METIGMWEFVIIGGLIGFTLSTWLSVKILERLEDTRMYPIIAGLLQFLGISIGSIFGSGVYKLVEIHGTAITQEELAVVLIILCIPLMLYALNLFMKTNEDYRRRWVEMPDYDMTTSGILRRERKEKRKKRTMRWKEKLIRKMNNKIRKSDLIIDIAFIIGGSIVMGLTVIAMAISNIETDHLIETFGEEYCKEKNYNNFIEDRQGVFDPHRTVGYCHNNVYETTLEVKYKDLEIFKKIKEK